MTRKHDSFCESFCIDQVYIVSNEACIYSLAANFTGTAAEEKYSIARARIQQLSKC